jgi:ribosomal 30S subunit maturation factor RimM
MTGPRFVHDDIVRLVHDQIGTVKEVHQTDTGYLYVIQLRTDTAQYIEVPEAELELLKIANADETGLHIRYIT